MTLSNHSMVAVVQSALTNPASQNLGVYVFSFWVKFLENRELGLSIDPRVIVFDAVMTALISWGLFKKNKYAFLLLIFILPNLIGVLIYEIFIGAGPVRLKTILIIAIAIQFLTVDSELRLLQRGSG